MVDQNPDAKLVALIDVKEKQALNLGFDGPFFKSPGELLAGELPGETQVVNIATPTGLHAKQANNAWRLANM